MTHINGPWLAGIVAAIVALRGVVGWQHRRQRGRIAELRREMRRLAPAPRRQRVWSPCRWLGCHTLTTSGACWEHRTRGGRTR